MEIIVKDNCRATWAACHGIFRPQNLDSRETALSDEMGLFERAKRRNSVLCPESVFSHKQPTLVRSKGFGSCRLACPWKP